MTNPIIFLNFFHNLDDILVADDVILADFLRLVFNRSSPNQSTKRNKSKKFKFFVNYKKKNEIKSTDYLNSLMMDLCNLLQKSSMVHLSDCKTTGEL